MMTDTCKGVSERSDPWWAGTAASDIGWASNREDFLFLGRKQLIDFADHTVGRLLHICGQTLLIILGDLVVLLELLHRIEPVAANVAHGDLGRFGVFMRDLDQL